MTECASIVSAQPNISPKNVPRANQNAKSADVGMSPSSMIRPGMTETVIPTLPVLHVLKYTEKPSLHSRAPG